MNQRLDYQTEFKLLSAHLRTTLKEKIRHSPGITQSALGRAMHKSQNAINNWLTENEKYQCIPNAVDFLILCKILDLKPDLFLAGQYNLQTNQEPTTASTPREQKKQHQVYQIHESKIEMAEPAGSYTSPFIRTSITRSVADILETANRGTGIFLIETVAQNGSTRALREYAMVNQTQTVYLSGFTSMEAMLARLEEQFHTGSIFQWLKEHKILILLDHADSIGRSQRELIAGYFLGKHPLVFIQKVFSPQETILEKETVKYILPAITRDDLHALSRGYFPGITTPALDIIETIARGRIDNLMKALEKINRRFPLKTKLTKTMAIQALLPGKRK